MKQATVSCASCGHLFPLEFVRQRSPITCNCGMRICAPSLGPAEVASMSATALVILVVLVALLIAAYALGRRLLG